MPTALHPRHSNSLGFVRFMLATMVIFGHSFDLAGRPDPLARAWTIKGLSLAAMAVDGFFVLSGFLITASYLADPRPARYLSKRVRRIVPGFVVAYLVTTPIVGPLAAGGAYFSIQNWKSLALSLLTLNVPNQAVGVFLDNPVPQLNGSLWTIRYEFACYLMILGFGVLGLLRWPRLVLGLGLAATLAYAAQGQLWESNAGGFRSRQLEPIPRFVSFFLAGAVFQLHRDWIRLRLPWLALAALGFVASFAHPLTYRALGPWLGGLALLGFGSRSSLVGRWFESLPDVSYGMYLYAFPIQNLLIANVGKEFPVTFGLGFLFSVLVGVMSWYGVERTWVRSRRQSSGATRAGSPEGFPPGLPQIQPSGFPAPGSSS